MGRAASCRLASSFSVRSSTCSGRDDPAISPGKAGIQTRFRGGFVTTPSHDHGLPSQPEKEGLMSTPRENIYRCTLVTGTRRLAGHVRAWDEREAVALFREELADTGIKARGNILVRNLAGGQEHPVEMVTS